MKNGTIAISALICIVLVGWLWQERRISSLKLEARDLREQLSLAKKSEIEAWDEYARMRVLRFEAVLTCAKQRGTN